MLGWSKKTLSQAERTKLEAEARKTLFHIEGQVDGSAYCVAGGRIDLTDPQERYRVMETFKGLWNKLSKNRENWPTQISEFVQFSGAQNSTKFDQAAVILIVGIVKTDAFCRIALQYPDDRQVRELIFGVLSRNFAAFDYIMTGRIPTSIADASASPSVELLPELQYANSFFDKTTFG